MRDEIDGKVCAAIGDYDTSNAVGRAEVVFGFCVSFGPSLF